MTSDVRICCVYLGKELQTGGKRPPSELQLSVEPQAVYRIRRGENGVTAQRRKSEAYIVCTGEKTVQYLPRRPNGMLQLSRLSRLRIGILRTFAVDSNLMRLSNNISGCSTGLSL